MAENREVAGLFCSDVLEMLSDYIDGTLPPDRVAQIGEHLQGCDWCEHFGGRFSAAVTALRRELTDPAAPATDVRTRLLERLRREAAG
jgi:anti-sigma factor RsiW